MKPLTIRFLTLSLLLCNCSAQKTAPSLPDMTFDFEVNQNADLTLFSLSAKRNISNTLLSHRHQLPSKKTIEKTLLKRLRWQFEQETLCAEGYREISRSIGVDFAIIRGECN